MDAHDRAGREMIIQSADPFNAEPAPAALIASFVTLRELFYIRSNGPVPTLSADQAVSVDGMVDKPAIWTRETFERSFATTSVLSTMQCAGNRRADLQQVKPTAGDPWGVGAIGTAEWTGVRLADVLAAAGFDRQNAKHVRFLSADEVLVEGERDSYGVSIPLAKALHPDTLIAWAINGVPLPPEHGFPLRMVVPGYAGVRSAKWLTRIEVSEAPAIQLIQAKDYKLFPPAVAKGEADWDAGLVINAMPVNAAICDPADRAVLKKGPITIRGYALAGDRAVARVDVSLNGGRDWCQAELEQRPDAPWSWTRWSWTGEIGRGNHEFVVRAVDEAGQTQPSAPDDVWNFAGYLATNWHRVRVEVGQPSQTLQTPARTRSRCQPALALSTSR